MEITRLSTALAILTSMIMPAVLISACGTLILSTSNRLGRVVDRVRKISETMEQLAHATEPVDLLAERRTVLVHQLTDLIKRAQLLQRALRSLYLSVCAFVTTSVAIGVIRFSDESYSWISVALGLVGTALLFYVSVLLIAEARLAATTLGLELDFVGKLTRYLAPDEVEKVSNGGHRRLKKVPTARD